MTSNQPGAGNSARATDDMTVLYGMNVPFLQVRAFHQAFDHPCPDRPKIQPDDRADKRASWIEEECDELRAAKTLRDQVDAYTDILYFALGGMVELGVLPQAIFDKVHAANMAKLHYDKEGNAYVKRREHDGKVVKPDGWAENFAPEPHISAELEKQWADRPLSDLSA